MTTERDDVPDQPLSGSLALTNQSAIVCYLSIDTDSRAGRRELYNLIAGESIPVEDVIGKPLQVIGYVCHGSEIEDPESGEVRSFVRTVLVTADGRRVSSGSDILRRRLHDLELVAGRPPWDPPLFITVIPVRSRSKRTYYTIRCEQ